MDDTLRTCNKPCFPRAHLISLHGIYSSYMICFMLQKKKQMFLLILSPVFIDLFAICIPVFKSCTEILLKY